MGLWRNIFSASTISSLNNPQSWLLDVLAGSRTASGEHVSPSAALALSAYWAALRAISEDVAKVPLGAFEPLEPAGRKLLRDHPATRLLSKQPNLEMTAVSFREVMQSNALSEGNGYAEIVRNGRGEPLELLLLHPSNVIQKRNEDGELFFVVRKNPQKDSIVLASNMFHIHGLGPNGMQGYSIARLGAESLGLSLAMQEFAASFFRNSMRPSGVLETDMKHDVKQEDLLKRSFEEGHSGKASMAARFMVLWGGLRWKSITIPPNEAQLVETRQFQIKEIARWFRMPLSLEYPDSTR